MNKLIEHKKYLFSLILGIGIFLVFPIVVQASTFTVDSTGDGADASIDGLCADSGGECTLRAAIQEANATAGPHTIAFNIPTSDSGYVDFDTEGTPSTGDSTGGDDFWTIKPATALPTITASGVTIDGATQTTNQGNFNTSGPEVLIDGHAGGQINGLVFSGTNGTVNSLTIYRFGSSHSTIEVQADGFILTNSYIGTGAKGLTGASGTDRSAYGVYMNAASGTIGTTTSNGNVISGNATYGIYAACGTGGGKTVNIAGNKIGVNASGSAAIANGSGIVMTNDCISIIGGDTAANRNIISGNPSYSIYLSLSNNTIPDVSVYNNFIGPDITGVNAMSTSATGVYVTTTGTQSNNTAPAVKVGAQGKSNLFRHIFRGFHMEQGIRNSNIEYNSMGNIGEKAIMPSGPNGYNDAWGTPSLSINIKNNYIGTTSSDPYFGLSLGAIVDRCVHIVGMTATSNIIISDNTFNVCGVSGIGTSFVGNLTITNNTITNAGSVALTIRNAVITNNIITGNLGGGIQVKDPNTTERSKMQNNIIYGNALYDIDQVTNGSVLPSVNDAGDVDAGGNDLMNWPVIDQVTRLGPTTFRVQGKLDGNTSEAPFTIEICKSDNRSSGVFAGYGGCTQSLGFVTTASTPDSTSGSSNYFNFTKDVTTSGGGTLYFTALATNSLNATSEFGTNASVSVGDAYPEPNGDGTYTITVDSTGDEDHVSTSGQDDGAGAYSGGGLTGASGNADGKTTLREAIIVANNFNPAGEVKIAFNIPTTDTGYRDYEAQTTLSSGDNADNDDFWTIEPATVLPTITASDVTIDGATQTTNQGDRNTSGPEIQINGTAAGEVKGLVFSGLNGSVNGITINRFGSTVAAIEVTGDGFSVTNSYIGPDAKGLTGYTTTNRSAYGIYMNVASGTIGTTTSNGNVISGNATYGIYANCGTGGSGKTVNVAGNKIGLGADADTSLANSTAGIYLTGQCISTIGGNSANNRNYIAGGGSYGIQLNLISCDTISNVQIYNNFFGTDLTGAQNRGFTTRNIFVSTTAGVVCDNTQNPIIIGGQNKGNLFRFAPARNIDFDPARKAYVGYNTVGDTTGRGINFTNPSTTIDIEDIVVEHNYIGAFNPDPYFGQVTSRVGNHGILFNNSGASIRQYIGVSVIGNVISGDNNTASFPAIGIGRAKDSIISGNTIYGNNLGILFDGPNNIISENEVYNSSKYGIGIRKTVEYETSIKLSGNKVYNNGLNGTDIDLDIFDGVSQTGIGSGLSSNDEGDGDSGPNSFMNWPEITEVLYLGAGQYKVSGRLDGKVSEAPFEIEVCESDGHTSGHGGCTDSLGTTITSTTPDSTNGSSNYFNFSKVVQTQYSGKEEGIIFTTLATNNLSSTSEFGTNFVCTDDVTCPTVVVPTEEQAPSPTPAITVTVVPTSTPTAASTTVPTIEVEESTPTQAPAVSTTILPPETGGTQGSWITTTVAMTFGVAVISFLCLGGYLGWIPFLAFLKKKKKKGN